MWKYQTMGSVEDVSINPHAKLIGVGGMDGCIYILNYSGNLINKRNLNSSINSSVYYLKLTNCYNYNIIAYNSLKVHYLDKNLTTLWTYCPDSSTYIEIKDATPDGKYIALFTNCVDYLTYDDCEGYLEILNKNGTIAWQYPVFDDVSYAKITSDGRYVIAIVDDKLCFFDNQKCIKNYESQNHKHGVMVGNMGNRGLLIYVVVITLGIMIILLALAFYVIKLDKKSNK
jgi:outer membrane protein assembly factor BamB